MRQPEHFPFERVPDLRKSTIGVDPLWYGPDQRNKRNAACHHVCNMFGPIEIRVVVGRARAHGRHSR